MRDLTVLFLHLLTTVARLAGPGGARSVVAECLLLKQQLLILNRSRKRSHNLHLSDRLVAGVCALLIRPRRLVRSAIVRGRLRSPHPNDIVRWLSCLVLPRIFSRSSESGKAGVYAEFLDNLDNSCLDDCDGCRRRR